MARKKKKQSRKELKQQRQEIVARKRAERGWRPARPSLKSGPDEIVLDTLPLFPLLEDGPPDPETLEELMAVIYDSADLAEEPEFDEILVDPMRCTELFAEVGDELGIELADLVNLPAEEREEIHFDMLEKTAERLLTDELRAEILVRLDKLRFRLKEARLPREAARAAMLQMILRETDRQSRALQPTLGLVQAIVERSLQAGFALIEASMLGMKQWADETPAGEFPNALQLLRAKSPLEAEQLINEIPGLAAYLEKQTDKIWDEGTKALLAGELQLELFSEEELEGGMEIFEDVFVVDGGDDEDEGEGADDTPKEVELAINAETSAIFKSRLDDYLAKLLTPERVAQIQTRLETILDEESYPTRWKGFMLFLAGSIVAAPPTAADDPFLYTLFFSELLNSAWFVKDSLSVKTGV